MAGCAGSAPPAAVPATRAAPAPVAPARVIDTSFALNGVVTQGGLLTGVAPEGTVALRLDGMDIRLDAARRFAFGFGRDAGGLATLDAVQRDGTVLRQVLRVAPRSWKIDRLPALGSVTGETNPEYEALRASETAQLRAGKAVVSAETGWTQRFIWSAAGRISGVYGSQRILGTVERQPHYGVDIAAPTGTPIVAPADGVVVLARGPFSLEGNAIMLDHGRGLVSLFLHLSKFEVSEGQRVRQGERLGRIGTTGRSTGPHLHWGMTLVQPGVVATPISAADEVRIDPALLVPAPVNGRTP
ncbi:M23 family metallopeptidase [Sandaracinobacteroides saxicola]|uniref:M23 family metallopeptidase n=2 Tax=Sandaracinobacteroides saxicola TaxID=2759707 RepID=A0A7G5IMC2_9SPHN|nr:M23 family metallopeptidase [Sandaracinobacteroides saxicola]